MKKNVLCLLVAMVALILPQWTYAYSYTGNKQCYFYVNWRWGGSITDGHKAAFQQSLTDWNNAQSKKRFVNRTDAEGVLDSYTNATDGYIGYTYTIQDSSNCITSWVSKVNKYYDADYLYDPTYARSAAGHELGHVLGLAHTNNTAIMNPNRNYGQIYVPQTDDINGIANLY
jgi:predicted Zn-dependent protease